MSEERINKLILLNEKNITELMSAFNPEIKVTDFTLMTESMSNTGYKVSTDIGTYLLKLFSKPRDGIECAMYSYLKDKTNVPEIYYYDNSKLKTPYAYCIIKFIDGVTLADYIRKNRCYPLRFAYEIGTMCAAIHKKRYPSNALIDDKLNITRKLPNTYKRIIYMLGSKPATYLKPETVRKLSDFIYKNKKMFNRLDDEIVLCHGDFNYWNVMISNDHAYCIDFEFAYAGSKYHDIGHFFRRKSDDIQSLVDDSVYDAFENGYNSVSKTKLPPDWLRLAQLCDINAMLCLFNNDNFPEEWIADIERDILTAINSDC